MLSKPDLTFKAQQAALAEAAKQVPQTDQIYGQALQSAQNLIASMSNKGTPEGAAGTGVTKEALATLYGSDDIASQIEALRNQISGSAILNGTNQNKGSFRPGGPTNNYSPKQGEIEQYLYNGLITRGFTPEQSQAFILNFKDESGLRADIVEGAPNVHGTRGQGIYQLTDTSEGKGRRSDYLNMMKQAGRDDLWSYDSQMDFLKWETENTEKAAWAKIASLQGVGNIASGIVGDFLRPAEKHRISRQKAYLSLGY